MSLEFINDNNRLEMVYYPESGDISWFLKAVKEKTEEGGRYLFKKTYRITSDNFVYPAREVECFDDDFDSLRIAIGNYNPKDRYVYLDKDVFGIDYDFAFSGDLALYTNYFTRDGVSLIQLLSRTASHAVFIDSNKKTCLEEGHISLNDFKTIAKKIPTRYELEEYTQSVIQNLVEDYFDKVPDYKTKYENYVKRKRSKTYTERFPDSFYEFKLDEYQSIYDELKRLLRNKFADENTWQNKIIDIIKLIYPKYIVAIPQFEFESLGKIKRPDFIVIDADGDVDVIEIKKANIGTILKEYRGNYVPKSELSGAIVQTEQYTYLLKSEKTKIERYIQEKYAAAIGNLKINIINPQGIIIGGRSDDMNKNEKTDFEVIKRMHKNISEILTFDDLLKRLKNLIDAFSRKAKAG